MELAVRGGSTVFLPYYLLAHHRLGSKRYEECLRLCDEAARKEAPASIASELAEWTAIARAELGFSPDLVHAALEKAIRLDTSNDRARRNLERFDSAQRTAQLGIWETRSETAVRASGHAERPWSMAA